MSEHPPTIYRISEAAEILGVSDDTVRRWIDQGRLAASMSNGRSSIDGTDLATLAETLADSPESDAPRTTSARNRLSGIVVAVKSDAVMAQVELICGPNRIVSLMSADSADDLGLVPGARAVASIKSTNVIVERA
jgi:molybdopterin-binding protein